MGLSCTVAHSHVDVCLQRDGARLLAWVLLEMLPKEGDEDHFHFMFLSLPLLTQLIHTVCMVFRFTHKQCSHINCVFQWEYIVCLPKGVR